jgi:hypothetical protein
MIQSSQDGNLYYLQESGQTVILVLYVDDLFITGDHLVKVRQLQKLLHSKFEMTYLGHCSKYLGLEFVQTKSGIKLHQQAYAKSILFEFGLMDCNASKTPLPAGFKLRKDTQTPLVDKTLYQRMIGKLKFLTHTRYDIAFVVNLVSHYMTHPQQAHLKVVKCILRYIKGTLDFGLFYPKRSELTLCGYSDADWGGDLDQRRSTRAFVFTANGTPITWSSKKQTCVALSSCESEYRALVEVSKEAIWIQNLYKELSFLKEEPTTIYCDNQSSIKISKNPQYHSKSKHFEIHLHFVRDMVNKKQVKVLFIPTNQQPADIFTKSTWNFEVRKLSQPSYFCLNNPQVTLITMNYHYSPLLLQTLETNNSQYSLVRHIPIHRFQRHTHTIPYKPYAIPPVFLSVPNVLPETDICSLSYLLQLA